MKLKIAASFWTNDISALSAGSLSHSLLAVSDFLRGDTTYQTGPLVHKRDCFEAGTLHRVPDGEALREGVTYEFRVQYAEALSVAAGMRSEDAGLAVRSYVLQTTNGTRNILSTRQKYSSGLR